MIVYKGAWAWKIWKKVLAPNRMLNSYCPDQTPERVWNMLNWLTTRSCISSSHPLWLGASTLTWSVIAGIRRSLIVRFSTKRCREVIDSIYFHEMCVGYMIFESEVAIEMEWFWFLYVSDREASLGVGKVLDSLLTPPRWKFTADVRLHRMNLVWCRMFCYMLGRLLSFFTIECS